MTDVTGDVGFGDRVVLSHVVRPVYLRWVRHEERAGGTPAAGRSLSFHPIERVEVEPYLARTDWHPDVNLRDIGLPLPDPSPEPPRSGTHRRLRRWPSTTSGLVVGWTFRMEGQYHPKEGRAWTDEDDIAFLEESRRVRVLQVAVAPEVPDGHPYPAAIVLAVPADVTPESDGMSHPHGTVAPYAKHSTTQGPPDGV